ncbi:hypothetical protein ACQP1P_09790 [Dactylosporangium sp. CA-052675]|uniref:hypothetical protein n=1 Tax=Dactylosporangium sp. CA-052675 TaxID=3239927 RepID=UPI003D949B16
MSTVDVTERLDLVEQLIVGWDFPGARAEVQRLLDEPGLSDDDRLTARRFLAEVLRELGELDAAYDLAEAVASQAERRYGQTDPRTVHAVAVLAAVRHDHDEWDDAERLYHRVLDSGVDEDGHDSLARAVRLARVNLALLQRDRGETASALALLNAAYVIHRREYGAEDLDTIRIAAELAALLYATGDVLQARRLFTLAHAAARARLGTRHPFTKAVEWELAAVEPPMPSAPISMPPPPVVVDPVVVRTSTPPTPTSPTPTPPIPPPPAPAPRVPPPVDPPPWVSASADPPPWASAPADPAPWASASADPPPWASASADPAPWASASADPAPWASAPPAPARRVPARPAPARPAPAAGQPSSLRSMWPLLCLVALLAAVFAGLLVWHHEGPPDPFSASGPTSAASSAAPFTVAGLRIEDGGRELTVTWAALPVSVVIALSRAGGPATVLGTLPPGTTEYVVRDVDPTAAYCVVLGPVDEAVSITPATSACTAGRG